MKNRPNTSVPLARFSFPIVLFVSGMLLSLLTACDFCILFGCKELPNPAIYYQQWVGEYTQSSEWYGEQSGGEHSITGILHTDVTIAVKDSSLHLKVVVGSDPGQLLAFETVADVVSDSLLGYAFTDNWGAKGRGQFFRLDDGSFQLNNDIVDDPNMTAVGMLYGRHNVLQVIPDFENTYNTKAEAYYKQQQYNKAIRLTEVLLQGHPKNTRALGNIGLFHLKGNNNPAAKLWMQRALGRLGSPKKRAEVYYNRGQVAEAEGEAAAAVLYYKISYYLRPHTSVRDKLNTLAPQDDLPQALTVAHPSNTEGFWEFQKILYQKENHFLSPEALSKLYYSLPEGEIAAESTRTTTHQGFISEIEYTVDSIRDDSIAGIKYNFFLVRVNHQWEILDIRFSFKCHPDRGHTEWGVAYCL